MPTISAESESFWEWIDYLSLESPRRCGVNLVGMDDIDAIDRKILLELSRDARLPIAELGRRVGLSPSATNERVKHLESLQIIQRYRAKVDLKALGLNITAFIRLTCDGQRYRPFLKFLDGLESVHECHHLTGADAFLLKVLLASTDELETLIEKLLPYGIPTTSLVLSTPIARDQHTHLQILAKPSGLAKRTR